METFINVECPTDGTIRLHADEVTFYVDLAQNAAHEFYCPRCGTIRVHIWDTTKAPARDAALFLEQTTGVTVHRVAWLGKTLEQTARDFGETFTGQPLLTSTGMWSELDRYTKREQRAQA